MATMGDSQADPAVVAQKRGSSIKEVVDGAGDTANKDWVDYGRVSEAQASQYKQAGADVAGYKRSVAADEVRKILRDHGNDPLPVTKHDFERLPELTATAGKAVLQTRR